MRDQSTLERQWAFIRILGAAGNGVTAQELAVRANVSERTVKRDLRFLKQVGFPFEESSGEHNLKYWRVDAERALPAALRWDEAAAMFIGRQLMQSLDGTWFAESFGHLAEKVELALSNEAKKLLERMASSILIHTGPRADYSFNREHLEALQIAVDERRLTWLTYHSQSATEPVTYEVHPYGLVFAKNSIYLIAFSTSHREVRHFKLDRIKDVDAQQLKFPKPADFDLTEHLANSWSIFKGRATEPIEVRVRFAPEVSRYVQEKRWHASQVLSPQPDGSLIAEFTLTATEELKAWLLSFGPKAEVLAPLSLRDEVISDLQAALQSYQGKPLSGSKNTSVVAAKKRRAAR